MANKILLVEDDPATADAVHGALAGARDGPFVVEWVRRLSDALERLGTERMSALLVNLFLPDSQGIETFEKLLPAAAFVPILVVSSAEHEDIARQAVQRGAQDYLLTDHIDRHTLQRALYKLCERRVSDDALFLERERAQVILDSIGDAVLGTDLAGNITYLNLAAERMTGWSRQEAAGRPFAEILNIVDGTTHEACENPLALAVQQNQTVALSANCVLVRRDGLEMPIEDTAAPIRDRAGQVTGAVMVFHDVSETRAMTLRMSHLAQHDFLTDLPNRTLLNDRLTQAIALARRQRRQLALLLLDLDRFKHINDCLGHAIGDKLLQSVTERLRACVRESDTVSRPGGDEFMVLLTEVKHMDDVALGAEKILAALTAPHSIDHHELHVTASIGISIYPDDGQDAVTLIRSADTAMHHTKENGRNHYQFFKRDMNARAVERHSIEGSLRRALVRREFVLHYQPKINLVTGAITGVEALIRWQHPERGLLLPAQFVPIAEDCGLIVPIGYWVLCEACRQTRAWLDAGLPPMTIAVNVSAVEFRGKHFVEGIRDTLKETSLEPHYLELELTESVLMEDAESAVSVLQALKRMGVQLSVDDFGTGYSSLSYLKQFPIDILKIDQSFVRDITTDPNDATIVSAVIGMGRRLKHRVIAEGVETPEQLAFLADQACGEGQGYYFSRPVDAEEFARLLESGGISDTDFD